MTLDIRFLTCPTCSGYGVRDSGANCWTCGGSKASRGSGEIMLDRKTGRKISLREFNRYHTQRLKKEGELR